MGRQRARQFDVAVYFKLLGHSEEEVEDLVRIFAQQFRSRHRAKIVPEELTEKGSIVVEVDK